MPRRGRWLAVGLSLVGLVAAAVPASADDVSDLQQRASQIVQQQAVLEEQASNLTDQLNGAQVELDKVRDQVAAVQARLDDQQEQLVGLNAQLTQFAVRSYVYGDTQNGLGTLLAGEVPGKDVAARQGYTELIFGENRDIVDTVKEQHVEADRERAQLQTALGRQQALLTTIERYRGQVQDNQRQLESLLSQVQGDLAQAVADADARRQAEDDRKAREAAARQAADFQRQQAAAQQRRSSTTTTLNLDNVTRTSARPSTSTTADDGTPGLPAPSATLPPSTTKAPTTTKPPAPAPPPVVNVPAPNPGAARAVQAAIAQLNKPYKFASADPAVGFDCSGLTSYAWAQAGVGLPHYSKAQWEMVRPVPLDALQPGDLVFFYYPAVSHVGLYIGGGMMVDAQGPGYTVRQASIYGRGLFAAGRPG